MLLYYLRGDASIPDRATPDGVGTIEDISDQGSGFEDEATGNEHRESLHNRRSLAFGEASVGSIS
ncbi:MAG: hypothetical protein WBW84_18865, partial [Acidobacteriaceae bacterium]